jgi:hypothetical protein
MYVLCRKKETNIVLVCFSLYDGDNDNSVSKSEFEIAISLFYR